MSNEEIDKLVELFKSPVKDIRKEGQNTIIEFENGEILPLIGAEIELKDDSPKCNFCGVSSRDRTLFTRDDKNYICPECTTFALTIFLKNGIDIAFEIGDLFPGASEQLKKLFEK